MKVCYDAFYDVFYDVCYDVCYDAFYERLYVITDEEAPVASRTRGQQKRKRDRFLRKMRNDEREKNEEKKEEEKEKAAEEEKQQEEEQKAAEGSNDIDLNSNIDISSVLNVEEAEEEEDEDSDLRHGNDTGFARIEEEVEDVVIADDNKEEHNNNDSNANDQDDAAIDAFLEEDSDDAEDEDDDVKTEAFNYIEYQSYSIGGKKYREYKEGAIWSKKVVKWRGKRNIENGNGLLWLCTMDPSTCNKAFGRSTTLKEHMEDHHVTGDSRYECEWHDCFKTYSKRSAVINHITTKHLAAINAAYKYSCKQCGQAHEHSMAAWRCCKNNDSGDDNEERNSV